LIIPLNPPLGKGDLKIDFGKCAQILILQLRRLKPISYRSVFKRSLMSSAALCPERNMPPKMGPMR
jgi:hypothetical protein